MTNAKDGKWEDTFCGGYTSQNQPRDNSETRKEILEIIEKMCPWYEERTKKLSYASVDTIRQLEEAFRDV